jgi:hypothetical protein
MRCSRRSFLSALGLGPALLPLLEAEEARAACGGAAGPKRAFIMAWTGGMYAGTGSSWATTGDNFVLPVHMTSLEPHRADLLLLDGLDYRFVNDSPIEAVAERNGHASFQGLLTAALYQGRATGSSSITAGGPSIDQHIGGGLRNAGYAGLASLNLAVCPQTTARLAWRAAGDAIVPNSDPFKAFASLVAGSAMSARKLRMRQSVLDYVHKDLNRFVRKVGSAADRAKAESHLEHIRALEKSLAERIAAAVPSLPAPGSACNPVSLGDAIAKPADVVNFERVTKLQIDVAVAALAADATRSVVLQLGDQNNSDVILYSAGFEPAGQRDNAGDLNGLHNISHRDAADKVRCDTWFMSQVAYVLHRLKGVTEASSTLLDNTAFLGLNTMRSGGEQYLGVPAILAGKCGGYFKTGRSLKLPAGTPNNGVLIALANAVGVPTPTFGAPQYGGELAGLRG